MITSDLNETIDKIFETKSRERYKSMFDFYRTHWFILKHKKNMCALTYKSTK
jgi:hypothetical protein